MQVALSTSVLCNAHANDGRDCVRELLFSQASSSIASPCSSTSVLIAEWICLRPGDRNFRGLVEVLLRQSQHFITHPLARLKITTAIRIEDPCVHHPHKSPLIALLH